MCGHLDAKGEGTKGKVEDLPNTDEQKTGNWKMLSLAVDRIALVVFIALEIAFYLMYVPQAR